MKKNMGNIDRFARITIALAIFALYFAGFVNGTLAFILLAVAGIFIATGVIGFCPLYLPFGISTCKSTGIAEKNKAV